MAGLGRRIFAAGEVLTAGNVMGYLQDQAVMTFASSAARGSALGTAVSEGMVTYLKDVDDIEVYDGAAWKQVYPANASDIAAGTLAVARGGTGATTGAGLVPIIPTSIDRSGGSHSVSTLGAVTFSGVSAISLNGVFSSAYKNYRMIVTDIVGSVAGAQAVSIRFRVSGADNTTSNYYQYWTMKRLTGVLQDNTGGPSTSYALVGYDSSANNSYNWHGDINAPFATKNTTVLGLGYGTDATSSYTVTSTVLFNSPTSFTGISVFPSANALSGTVQIFGYNQ